MNASITRTLRFASTSFLVQDGCTTENNLERIEGYVHDAAERGASILCLPEYSTTNGVTSPNIECEYWVSRIASLAEQTQVALIFPTILTETGKLYSAAFAINHDGSVAGVYRKVQPNGAELRMMSAGNVIDPIEISTRHGKLSAGIMLCMDLYFPEIARIYAMKGADVLFWPTVMLGPTQEILLAQLRTRAHDNSLPIVESNIAGSPPYAPYAGSPLPGNAKILDYNGDILAQTGRREGLAIADINLDDTRKTSQCVLLREPDETRRDLESLVRSDLYAKEYARLAAKRDSL